LSLIEGFVGPALWSVVEVNLSLICASVPALKPFFLRCFGKYLSRWNSGHSQPYGQSSGAVELGHAPALKLPEDGTPDPLRRSRAYFGKTPSMQEDEDVINYGKGDSDFTLPIMTMNAGFDNRRPIMKSESGENLRIMRTVDFDVASVRNIA
jgi:hypothetical protein